MVWACVVDEAAGGCVVEGLVDRVAEDFGPGSKFVVQIDGVIEFGGLIEIGGLMKVVAKSVGCSRELGLNEFDRFEFEFLIRGATHAIANAHWRVILGIEEPTLHQGNGEDGRSQLEPSIPDDNNVQPQPPQTAQSAQGSIPFPDLDNIEDWISFWD
ncbi:hypothetical protein U1Q18_033256 [Sarracenia purpurea var. burkii]